MEQLLHYVWKYRLFQKDLKTTDGSTLEVIDVGLNNTDGGPDFFNAKIKINDTLWAGNIEIHKTSDDWFRHKHETDKAYNSVILHVVETVTREIINEAGHKIPQCEIKYSKSITDNIDFLLNTDVPIPCCNYLNEFPRLHIQGWLNTLLFERLERKAGDIHRLSEKFNNSWTDVFYVLLSRSMGFGLNSDVFERIALSLPLKYILKQGDNIFQIEALLFGQSGLLQDITNHDKYTMSLLKEYEFLKNKYSLTPPANSSFRMLRIRPTGSPFVRIAQLASLLANIQGLYSRIINAIELGKIRLLFHVNASEYWQTHYIPGEESPRKNKYIGDASLDIMIINAVVPLVFSYGKRINNESLIDRALNYLEQIKPESNSIVNRFGKYGVLAENAYDSQALIQLKREYCEKKKCMYCRIGHKILSEKK